jgi:hypothetical protein
MGKSIDAQQPSTSWLLIGLGFLGLTTGWMIGGSGSPVVSAALPVLLGLGATTAQFVSDRQREKQRSEDEKANAASASSLRAGAPDIGIHHMGTALTAFSFPLCAGTLIGGIARLHLWLLPTALVPWDTNAIASDATQIVGPVDPQSLVTGIAFAANLRQQGYTDSDIKALVAQFYALQKAEHESALIQAATIAPNVKPPTEVSTEGADKPSDDPPPASDDSPTAEKADFPTAEKADAKVSTKPSSETAGGGSTTTDQPRDPPIHFWPSEPPKGVGVVQVRPQPDLRQLQEARPETLFTDR